MDARHVIADGAASDAVCVGLLLCTRSGRAGLVVVGVWPGGSDVRCAACRCCNGHCRRDGEVADSELHLEVDYADQ